MGYSRPIQAGPAAHRLGAVAGHRELHVNALEQGLSEGVDPRPQLPLACLGGGPVQDLEGAAARRPGTDVRRPPEVGYGARLGGGLDDQPFADVGVGIGAVEELQKAPALEDSRWGGPFQGLEAQQGGSHGTVGQQRPAPVFLQAEYPGGHAVRQVGVDEQPSVLAQHLGEVRSGVPQQGAPQHLVEVVVVALTVG